MAKERANLSSWTGLLSFSLSPSRCLTLILVTSVAAAEHQLIHKVHLQRRCAPSSSPRSIGFQLHISARVRGRVFFRRREGKFSNLVKEESSVLCLK